MWRGRRVQHPPDDGGEPGRVRGGVGRVDGDCEWDCGGGVEGLGDAGGRVWGAVCGGAGHV